MHGKKTCQLLGGKPQEEGDRGLRVLTQLPWCPGSTCPIGVWHCQQMPRGKAMRNLLHHQVSPRLDTSTSSTPQCLFWMRMKMKGEVVSHIYMSASCFISSYVHIKLTQAANGDLKHLLAPWVYSPQQPVTYKWWPESLREGSCLFIPTYAKLLTTQAQAGFPSAWGTCWVWAELELLIYTHLSAQPGCNRLRVQLSHGDISPQGNQRRGHELMK